MIFTHDLEAIVKHALGMGDMPKGFTLVFAGLDKLEEGPTQSKFAPVSTWTDDDEYLKVIFIDHGDADDSRYKAPRRWVTWVLIGGSKDNLSIHMALPDIDMTMGPQAEYNNFRAFHSMVHERFMAFDTANANKKPRRRASGGSATSLPGNRPSVGPKGGTGSRHLAGLVWVHHPGKKHRTRVAGDRVEAMMKEGYKMGRGTW